MGLTVGSSPAAYADAGDSSQSSAQFLSGSLLDGLDLSTVAGIAGAQAQHTDGADPSAPTVDNAALDVTALSTIGLALPGIDLSLGDLLELEAVTQQATAEDDAISSSSTGTASASLDLTALLGQTQALDAAALDLGAVDSSARLEPDPDNPGEWIVTRDYNIAEATLDLHSPVVGDIGTTTNQAIADLNTQVNGLSDVIETAVNGSVNQIINLVGGVTGTASTNTTVTVNSRIDEQINQVLSSPLSTDLVTIDPLTGQVTVNLAGGIDLNNLPPNSTLLSPEVMQQVSADVATLLGQLQSNLNDVITNAHDYIDITITSNTTLRDPVFGTTLGGLNIGYTGTVGDLLDGTTPITADGSGVLAPLDALLGPITNILVPAIGGAVDTALNTALATAGQAIDEVVTQATNTLAPVLEGLTDVVAVNVNVQNDVGGTGPGPYSVTAVQVTLLDDAGARLDLATSTVGPNVDQDGTAPEAPVIESPADGSSINDSTPTITGTGEPGATVEVSMDGAVIGTATVDADGSWSLPTTDALADGEHTVSAIQTDEAGNVSPADSNTFTIDTAAPEAPVIESPADGSTISDSTPAITGTGEPGATVEVSMDGAVIGTATVDADGSWSLPTTDALADGEHTVSAVQTDAAGNVSPADSNTFTIDSSAPDAPTITGPADGSTIGPDVQTVTGTAEPNATVRVRVDGQDYETQANADGAWTIDTGTPFTEGEHTATAVQVDAADNESPATTSTFTVDASEDAPVITGPESGTTTDDNTPTISGTGTPGTLITVYDQNDDVIGTARVDDTGSWTMDAPELADGTYTFTATATDDLGNVSPESNSVILTIDTAAPEAPVITSPEADSVTDDNTPTVTGTGEPGAEVEVFVDGVPVGTTTVDPAGNWSLELTTPLADGGHTATATQTDEAGNISPTSDPVPFTVDTQAPAAPVITSPADGDVIDDSTPTITGTGESGATVEVSIDGEVVGEATVSPEGTWELPLTDPLADGEHTVTATQTDEAGNVSEPSAPVTFTVDTTAPDAPVITSPTDGSTTSDTTPTITGTGEPGATVEVTIDGQVVGEATVDADGNWELPLTDPLADGEHTVTATQTDQAGNVSDPSAPVTFTVDAAAPEAPVITSPADGSSTQDTTPTISGTAEPGTTVEVTIDGTVVGSAPVDGDGSWNLILTDPLVEGPHTATATATDESGNTSDPSEPVTFTVDQTAPEAPVITGPADGSTVSDTTPPITGTGEPGATVEVVIDGEVVGEATVNPDGTWTFTPSEPLADGEHTVTATQTDEAGNTSEVSEPVSFTVDASSDAPVITSPESGDSTNDDTPAIEGTGNPGDTITVIIDGEPVRETTVDPDGAWTFTPTEPLEDGDHTITATATDPLGNTSGESNAVIITVDTTAPEAPEITSPADGGSTSDTTPTIEGTGEPGATVTVEIDGEEVGTAVVQPDGTWSLEVTDPLAAGEHTVEAVQTDPAGNTSPATTVDFTVTPAAPVITSPQDGDSVDKTPDVAGTGQPGANVTVQVDGKDVDTVRVGDDGTWSTTLPALECGDHTLTATQAVTLPEGGAARGIAGAAGRTVISPASDAVAIEVACAGNGTDPGGSAGSDGGDRGDDGNGGVLPNTGSPTFLAALLGLGIGLVIIGGLMVAGRFRRQS
ncbi:Ig-like domain-containing protein [Nocardioides sp. NPDC047086]|uniref:Ig-like domain-containing protein n=1 Tax=Nocardioides sp. NPDC047086 TaxID=3154810 RepID=UPI0033DBBA2A